MTTRAVRIVAASLFGLTAGTSVALAEAKRPWVDPPADLTAPAASREKPRVEEPAPAPVKAAPVTAKAPPEAEVGKAKPEAEVAKAKSGPKPEPVKVGAEAPAATGQVAEREKADQPKARASKRARAKVATKRAPKSQPRVAQRRNAPAERQDGLVVMQMQTLQFPDGRTMTVLTRPGEAPSPWAGARDAWR